MRIIYDTIRLSLTIRKNLRKSNFAKMKLPTISKWITNNKHVLVECICATNIIDIVDKRMSNIKILFPNLNEWKKKSLILRVETKVETKQKKICFYRASSKIQTGRLTQPPMNRSIDSDMQQTQQSFVEAKNWRKNKKKIEREISWPFESFRALSAKRSKARRDGFNSSVLIYK